MLVKFIKVHSLDDAPWTWKYSWNKDMPEFFQVARGHTLLECTPVPAKHKQTTTPQLTSRCWQDMPGRGSEGVYANIYKDLDDSPVTYVSRAPPSQSCLSSVRALVSPCPFCARPSLDHAPRVTHDRRRRALRKSPL